MNNYVRSTWEQKSQEKDFLLFLLSATRSFETNAFDVDFIVLDYL